MQANSALTMQCNKGVIYGQFAKNYCSWTKLNVAFSTKSWAMYNSLVTLTNEEDRNKLIIESNRYTLHSLLSSSNN
jgi:hypothetical protein